MAEHASSLQPRPHAGTSPGRRGPEVPRSLVDGRCRSLVISVIILLLPLFIPSFVVEPGHQDDDLRPLRHEPEPHLGLREHPQLRPRRLLRGRRLHGRRSSSSRSGISNFWLSLLLAIIATAVVAAILGVPAFRVFGVGAGAANPIYFLLATIAFGELLSRVAIVAAAGHRRVHRPVGHPRARIWASASR